MDNQLFSHDILNPIIGGVFIGASAVLMMLMNGRVVGISGILFQLSKPLQKPVWQLTFIIGLLSGALLYFLFTNQAYPRVMSSWELAITGGLLVGIGTRLGSGCTSGHGVCGISRFSPRSLVATFVFITTGIVTVSLISFSQ